MNYFVSLHPKQIFFTSQLNKRRQKTMAYVITDDCVMCGTCAGECPSEAIAEGDGKYVINADVCVDCGTCADACPSGAIVPGE